MKTIFEKLLHTYKSLDIKTRVSINHSIFLCSRLIDVIIGNKEFRTIVRNSAIATSYSNLALVKVNGIYSFYRLSSEPVTNRSKIQMVDKSPLF